MKKSRKKTFAFWLLLVANIMACLALAISYTAAWIKPSIFWPIAFFGLAYPLFMIINLLFVFYWMIRKRWTFLWSLCFLVLGWNTHLQYLQYNKAATETDARKLKVLSYNAHLFKPIKTNKYDKKSKHEMMQMLLAENADVMCFQEFYSRKKGVYDIQDSLKKAGYRYVYKSIFEENSDEELSVAIFSKLPIVHQGRVAFFEQQHANTCIYTDVLFEGDTVRVINVHLQSINFQPEDYQFLDKVKNEVEADVTSSKRIGYRLRRAFLLRGNQAELVRELIDDTNHPLVVCGDFNDTPNSYSFNVISNGLLNSFREQGNGIGYTYNGDFPNFQIDYILASKSFEVYSYKIIKKKYSDHYPICSELSLQQ